MYLIPKDGLMASLLILSRCFKIPRKAERLPYLGLDKANPNCQTRAQIVSVWGTGCKLGTVFN